MYMYYLDILKTLFTLSLYLTVLFAEFESEPKYKSSVYCCQVDQLLMKQKVELVEGKGCFCVLSAASLTVCYPHSLTAIFVCFFLNP